MADNCVVLNDVENGAVTYEAGGFLAWTDAEVSKTVPKYTINGVEYTKEVVNEEFSSDGLGSNPKTFTAKYTKVGGGAAFYSLFEDHDFDPSTPDEERAYAITGNLYGDDSVDVTVGEKVVKDGAVDVNAVNVLIGEENGWKPTEEGAYIFRRAIKNDSTPGASKTYTYSGFYFAPAGTTVKDGDGTKVLTEDTYYKIIIGNDTYATTVADADHDGIADIVFDINAAQSEVQTLGATINEDGTINGKVDYNFVEVKDSGNLNPVLKMDADKKRLVVGNSEAAAGDGNYDASAVAARAEIAYENAKKFSDLADTFYTYAQADVAYAKALAKERNDLIDAAIATQNAHDALDAKETLKDQELADVFGDGEAYDAFKDAYALFAEDNTSGDNDLLDLNPETFVPSNVRSATQAEHPQVYANYQALLSLYNTQIQGCITAIQGARVELNALQSGTDPDPAEIQAQIDIIKKNLKLLDNTNPNGYLQQYKAKYADIVNSVIADPNINMQNVNTDDQKDRIDEVIGLCDDAITAADNLDAEEAGYKDAYDEWQKAVLLLKNRMANGIRPWQTIIPMLQKHGLLMKV